MRPDDAVRQLEYVVASTLVDDSWSHWEERVYGDVFEYIDGHDDGTPEHMTALVEHLGTEIEDGYRPLGTDAQTYADNLLSEGGQPFTDGGEE